MLHMLTIWSFRNYFWHHNRCHL